MEELSERVREFLRDNIVSYEQLEALILLCRHTDEPRTAEAAGEALGISTASAESALGHLVDRGLLQHGTAPRSFVFSGVSSTGVVEELANVYRTNRLAIMNEMNANAIERVRTRAMQMFADAFVLGRKKDKNG